ncbi:hypothetical protein BH23ACT10_BH23ACT10_16910 [soil metagenome]
MDHQPRRRRARGAGVLLGVLLLIALGVGRTPPTAGPLGQRTARADTAQPAGNSTLDPRAEPVYRALNDTRTRAGLPAVTIDVDLVDSTVRDACAIARGEVALSGDRDRMTAAGGHRENTGMVIDDDPAAGAQTMHEWWSRARTHRRNRMDPRMTRYGVGACNAENRTYYVERFAP